MVKLPHLSGQPSFDEDNIADDDHILIAEICVVSLKSKPIRRIKNVVICIVYILTLLHAFFGRLIYYNG